MRVLYVSAFGGLGGAERSLLELVVAVRERGIEPMLVCPPGRLSEVARAADVPVYTWCARRVTRAYAPHGWLRSLPRVFCGWVGLHRALRQFRPQAVHVNGAQGMLWSGPVAALHGCPGVWHWRDFHDSHRVTRTMAHGADVVVTISEAMHAFAAQVLATAGRRLVLVRNGVADLPAGDPKEPARLRRLFGIPFGAPLVVMAGQSVPWKGHAVLLAALTRMTAQRPNLRAWLLAAEYDSSAVAHTRWLRRRAVELGCGDAVQITQGVEDIAPVLRAADVVVVPSLREPFGRIAVEAMLAERPVVASAVDGLTEIVAPGKTGLLVPAGRPDCLRMALEQMLADPPLWRSRGMEGRRRALQLFSISRAAAEVVSLYATLGRSFAHSRRLDRKGISVA